MAVLRQQVSFVKQLFLSGMIDATEAEEMTDPIEVALGSCCSRRFILFQLPP